MNPALVEQSAVTALQPFGLNVELVTVPSSDPCMVPVTPGRTVAPWLLSVSQAPGLTPPMVTNEPCLYSTRTRNVPSPLSLTLKSRWNVSVAQGWLHEPLSVEVVSKGPKWVSLPLPALPMATKVHAAQNSARSISRFTSPSCCSRSRPAPRTDRSPSHARPRDFMSFDAYVPAFELGKDRRQRSFSTSAVGSSLVRLSQMASGVLVRSVGGRPGSGYRQGEIPL